MRRQNHISAAPKAIPIRGPTTTPAIQTLLFGDEFGAVVCSVGCGRLELERMTLVEVVEVVAELDDFGTADVAPTYALSTKTPDFDNLGTY